ncbi:MAG: hypothetical protein R6U44_11200, partial [Archaeoglobaceae archaeon]
GQHARAAAKNVSDHGEGPGYSENSKEQTKAILSKAKYPILLFDLTAGRGIKSRRVHPEMRSEEGDHIF